ncbi:MAG: TonB-dependent receptor domain-containing protein, partial [Flammeovirgaceae bacterium]
AGGGYTVLGTEVIKMRLQDLEKQGLISSYRIDPQFIGKLEAERSLSFNVGTKVELLGGLSWDINLFLNTINNLIDILPVAYTIANQPIYSYRNIKRALTQGLETDFSYQLSKEVSLSLGYQLLFA